LPNGLEFFPAHIKACEVDIPQQACHAIESKYEVVRNLCSADGYVVIYIILSHNYPI